MRSAVGESILDWAKKWSGPVGPMGQWPRTPMMEEVASDIGPAAASELAEIVLSNMEELDGPLWALEEFAAVFAEHHPAATIEAFLPLLSPTCAPVVIHVLSATRDLSVLKALGDVAGASDTTEQNLVQLFDALTVLRSPEAKGILDSIDTTRLSAEARREFQGAWDAITRHISR